MDFIVVFITAPTMEEAGAIARTLIEEKLAGCVNIVRDIRSIYRWKEKIEDDGEVLLIVKSRKDLFELLKGRVKELHSYSIPEVIALPIIDGSEDYLGWLSDETKELNN